MVAHRGYPSRYPENSLRGFRAAVEAGAGFLELDVQVSRDGIPVVHHDTSLQRSCAVAESLLDTDLSSLRRMSAHFPARFGQRYKDTPINTLSEFAQQFASWPQLQAFVEIKPESLERHGVEKVMDSVLDALHAVMDQAVLISFDTACLTYARERNGVRIGWVPKAWSRKNQQRVQALKPDFTFASVKILPNSSGEIWRDCGKWAVYVVNDPAEALRYAEMGMSLVETDTIGEMLRCAEFAPSNF